MELLQSRDLVPRSFASGLFLGFWVGKFHFLYLVDPLVNRFRVEAGCLCSFPGEIDHFVETSFLREFFDRRVRVRQLPAVGDSPGYVEFVFRTVDELEVNS